MAENISAVQFLRDNHKVVRGLFLQLLPTDLGDMDPFEDSKAYPKSSIRMNKTFDIGKGQARHNEPFAGVGIVNQSIHSADTPRGRSRELISRELVMELEIHSQIEQEIFYPAVADGLRKIGDDDGVGIIDQCFGAHREQAELIQRLQASRPESTEFMETLTELQSSVFAHLEEEEKMVFPACDKLQLTEVLDLTRKLQARRAELIKQPRYQGSQAEVVQNPNGGEQMRKARTA